MKLSQLMNMREVDGFVGHPSLTKVAQYSVTKISEFGHTQSWSLARAFAQQTSLSFHHLKLM